MSQNFVGSVFGRLHGPPVVPFQERLKLLDVLVIVRDLAPLLREIQKFGLGRWIGSREASRSASAARSHAR
jgi:hypothetical protein